MNYRRVNQALCGYVLCWAAIAITLVATGVLR